MPRNTRVVATGLPYHVTQRGTNRERVCFTAGDRNLYLRLIRENQEEAGVRVLAYCLMTNHVHFMVIPEREDALALRFGRANRRYAQALNICKGRSGHLWQARYHCCVMSEAHLWIGLPVGGGRSVPAGLVREAADDPWSSAAAHLLDKPDRSHVQDMEF